MRVESGPQKNPVDERCWYRRQEDVVDLTLDPRANEFMKVWRELLRKIPKFFLNSDACGEALWFVKSQFKRGAAGASKYILGNQSGCHKALKQYLTLMSLVSGRYSGARILNSLMMDLTDAGVDDVVASILNCSRIKLLHDGFKVS